MAPQMIRTAWRGSLRVGISSETSLLQFFMAILPEGTTHPFFGYHMWIASDNLPMTDHSEHTFTQGSFLDRRPVDAVQVTVDQPLLLFN